MFGRSWELPLLPALRAARGRAARVGVRVDAQRLAVVRVAGDAGARTLEHADAFTVEAAHRADALRRLAHTGIFRQARSALVLGAGAYEAHPLPAPPVPDDELRDAVRWQLRGVLPYPPEEATIDFVRLPQAAEQPARPTLIVFAARTAAVEDAVRELADAGIEVDAVDVPELAQRNLGTLAAAVEGTHAWLSFDDDTCLLTVQLGDELAFARRLQAPGLRSESGADEAHALNLVERIGIHVQRSLELFERQSGLPPVLQLTIGPHPLAATIARLLADRTGIDSRLFDWSAAFAAGAVRRETQSDWLSALGAALRDDAAAAGEDARRGALAAWLQRLRAA